MAVRVLPDNSPYMFTDNPRQGKSLPCISISHSNDIAVSAAARITGIGIDIEKISDSILEIADEFSGKDELARVRSCAGYSKKAALTIIWTLKEASCKAYRIQDTLIKEITLKSAEVEGDYVVCELCYPNKARVRSVAFQSYGYVYAVSRLNI